MCEFFFACRTIERDYIYISGDASRNKTPRAADVIAFPFLDRVPAPPPPRFRDVINAPKEKSAAQRGFAVTAAKLINMRFNMNGVLLAGQQMKSLTKPYAVHMTEEPSIMYR